MRISEFGPHLVPDRGGPSHAGTQAWDGMRIKDPSLRNPQSALRNLYG